MRRLFTSWRRHLGQCARAANGTVSGAHVALPRAESSRTAGAPLAAKSALISMVPEARSLVLREARGGPGHRQVLRRYAALDLHGPGVADRVNGTASPHIRCLADIRRDLALTERHGRDKRLHAVAEDVDVPGAHRDAPAQWPPPGRALRSFSRSSVSNRSASMPSTFMAASTAIRPRHA